MPTFRETSNSRANELVSRKVGKSYSHTLDMVIDFFELPSERFEKSQTLPTVGMMQALFN
ncbi:hypothetical protein V1387_15690 [Allomuricauda taeanensis]|uniref:hypothetical protein n=1 Tax=Flagellimonas taeanensis TaxID=1005926 RepID=UPI002E7B0966|nr:hypothetical protein [Allomuricauda taeanensis]MEE1964133.1 hypothetical protein [Allomuricauda taeanensis]